MRREGGKTGNKVLNGNVKERRRIQLIGKRRRRKEEKKIKDKKEEGNKNDGWKDGAF